MDSLAIYFSIGGAAIGAVAGYLINKQSGAKPKSKLKLSLWILIPSLLLAQLGSMIAYQDWVRDLVYPPSQLEQYARAAIKELSQDSKFNLELKGKSKRQIQALLQFKSAAGLKRLPAADLLTWNRLRLTLAQKSHLLCAGFWDGRITPELILGAIHSLSEADQKSWIALSMKAAKLEVQNAAFRPPAANALDRGMKLISKALKPKDLGRFEQVIAIGPRVSKDDACWMILTLMSGAEKLEPKTREGFIRALATL